MKIKLRRTMLSSGHGAAPIGCRISAEETHLGLINLFWRFFSEPCSPGSCRCSSNNAGGLQPDHAWRQQI
jgi:hypothetical protein